MAQFYGVNATNRDVSVPVVKIPEGEYNGRVRFAYDSFTSTAVLAIGDLVNFMKLPKNARVMDAMTLSTAQSAGVGTLGWTSNGLDAANSTGLIAAIALTSAAFTRMAAEAGRFIKFQAETQVQLAITTATTAVGTIQCVVNYIVD